MAEKKQALVTETTTIKPAVLAGEVGEKPAVLAGEVGEKPAVLAGEVGEKPAVTKGTIEVSAELLQQMAAEIERMRTQLEGLAEPQIHTTPNVPIAIDRDAINKHLNETVPFYAFKDSKDYKDDIIVGINGHNWQIQRGVPVNIPRYVYNAIMDSERQRMLADDQNSGRAREFDDKLAIRKMA